MQPAPVFWNLKSLAVGRRRSSLLSVQEAQTDLSLQAIKICLVQSIAPQLILLCLLNGGLCMILWFSSAEGLGGQSSPVPVLPLGLALSPCAFTQCMDTALALFRLKGICVFNHPRGLFDFNTVWEFGVSALTHCSQSPTEARSKNMSSEECFVLLGVELNSWVQSFCLCLNKFRAYRAIPVGIYIYKTIVSHPWPFSHVSIKVHLQNTSSQNWEYQYSFARLQWSEPARTKAQTALRCKRLGIQSAQSGDLIQG